MNIKLYSVFTYDRSAKPRWLLEELGVPYQDHWLKREELESPEYLRINPMGRVPTLEIDGRRMIESDAICAYLADRFAAKDGRKLAPAPESPERMEYLQWMSFVGGAVQALQTRIQIVEDIPPGELYDTKFKSIQGDLRDVGAMLSIPLERSPTLLASGFSAADACLGYHLYFLYMWPELSSILADFPHVGAYLARLKQRPAAIRAQAFSYEG